VLFERNIKADRLSFTSSLEVGIKDAEIIFLALPTPPGEDGSADLSYILGVADELGKLIKDYKVIVDKSTVPVGTAEKVHAAVAKHAQVPFDVVSNPEFLREGFAVDDFLKPDRVVIGTSSDRAQKVMEQLYKPFVRQGNPIIFMDEKSAELTKYAANSFLATKITFMNEIANFCELVGADVDKVRIGIGSDDRIGKRFLFPGIGYGGSCFPKDVQALVKSGKEYNFDFEILNAVMEVNEDQKTILMPKIRNFFRGDLKGKKIAMWGLAFKPNTNDVREATSLMMIRRLVEAGATVAAYDPVAMEEAAAELDPQWLADGRVVMTEYQYDTLKGADAMLLITEWKRFRQPDFAAMKDLLRQPVIFDGRNQYDPVLMSDLGFSYYGIGRTNMPLTM
jgi:UDPglucose 6-dehydrogenase